MSHTQQTVILLIADPMFREGLKLLLEDMHFSVTPAGTYDELEKVLVTHVSAPALMIFPLKLNNGNPGIEYVRELRDRFNTCIPAILLSSENTMPQVKLTDAALLVLSEQTKANVFRHKITEILKKDFTA